MEPIEIRRQLQELRQKVKGGSKVEKITIDDCVVVTFDDGSEYRADAWSDLCGCPNYAAKCLGQFMAEIGLGKHWADDLEARPPGSGGQVWPDPSK